MSGKGDRILVVEDEAYVRDSLAEVLRSRGFAVRTAESAEEALSILGGERFDAVLSDLQLGGADGLELVRRIRATDSGLPVVILTGHGTVKSAVACLRAGADDYILKPADPDALSVALERAIDTRDLRREVRRLREDAAADAGGAADDPVGRSDLWRECVRRARAAAASESTVLLLGESGTGKELLAALIHRASGRAERPFVRVNCSAVPHEMWESEFFGHRKGSFTGATADRDGRFLQAHRGTLFLDEIGTMPLAAQAKVLRAIEEGEVDRLGDESSTQVDVRIVAATNADLEAEVKAGNFRDDLFYRLNVVPIRVPPLRERPEDVPLLAAHLAAQVAARLGRRPPTLAPGVVEDLQVYPWPGNVRELRNVVERAMILHPGDALTTLDLPQVEGGGLAAGGGGTSGAAAGVAAGDASLDLRTRMAAAERALIVEALRRSGGVRKNAAELLGVDPRNLPYYLKKHAIDPENPD